jgi:molecular chaperone HtpG
VTQGAADLDLIKVKDEAKYEATGDGATPVLIAAMKQALGDRVKDVRTSKRLTDSAVCLVADGAMDRTLEKLLSRQKDSGVSVSVPILEVNAGHPLIVNLAKTAKEKGATAVEEAAQLLLDQAFILEGEPVADPAGFARRMAGVMARVFS